MNRPKLPRAFQELLQQVEGKRARIVVEHILAHGFITTEDLEMTYGYRHPPRAIRDVREQGVPLETFQVKNSQGRIIAAYRFADPSKVRWGRTGGRTAFTKGFKEQLIAATGERCSICLEDFEDRYLQIDHRIPYELAGDVAAERNPEEYMLLCGSCNRAKSWSCEHCANWLEIRNPAICQKCYWASPVGYDHIALREIRRLDLVWSSPQEVEDYERLKQHADDVDEAMPDYVKAVIKKHLSSGK